jgi:hypothetical protein
MRKKGAKIDVDGGHFAPLPIAVWKSSAYLGLSHAAKNLLVEFLIQIGPSNNGHLIATRAKLRARGWTSQETISRCLKELEEAELIFKMFQGHRPNRASLYAVTWTAVSKSDKFDPGAHIAFRRGSWRLKDSPTVAPLRPIQGKSCTDDRGSTPISHASIGPAIGPKVTGSRESSVPMIGHLLEKPSQGGVCGGIIQLQSAASVSRVSSISDRSDDTFSPPLEFDQNSPALSAGSSATTSAADGQWGRVRDEYAHDTSHW